MEGGFGLPNMATVGTLAGTVGLGEQFKTAVTGIENLTGLSLSSPTECTPDRIDTPTVSPVLVSTAENPCKPNGFVNSLIGYVVVDSRNPSEYDTKNKNTLWYTSIGISAILIGVGVLYGQIDT
jgi:hypothetical protein